MIYFLHCAATGLTKIGKARDVVGRAWSIQCMSPTPLIIAAVLDGYTDEEEALHRKHADVRAHGEWFASIVAPFTPPKFSGLLGPVADVVASKRSHSAAEAAEEYRLRLAARQVEKVAAMAREKAERQARMAERDATRAERWDRLLAAALATTGGVR